LHLGTNFCSLSASDLLGSNLSAQLREKAYQISNCSPSYHEINSMFRLKKNFE
jgi:hypothetical protein